MKNLFKILGWLLILLAVVFFLYGSMKTASGEREGMIEADFGDGIVMVEENSDQKLAKYGFNTAAFLGIGGIVLILLGRKSARE